MAMSGAATKLKKGYWEVPMKPEDKDVTTFICHRGLFRFNVMPFGNTVGAATGNERWSMSWD